jgi:hypothetical protein
MVDHFRGGSRFDHGFLTGEIPCALVSQLHDHPHASNDIITDRDRLANHDVSEALARDLHAMDLQLNTALLVLQNPDSMQREVLENKIRIVLSILDVAIRNLSAGAVRPPGGAPP